MAGNQSEDMVHYNITAVDQLINDNNAWVFLRVKLYLTLLQSLNRYNALEIPPTHTGLIVALIPPDMIPRVSGDGVEVRVDNVPGNISLLMTVNNDGRFRFAGDWGAIETALGMRSNASLSLWLYFEEDEGARHLIVRLDGHNLKPRQGVYSSGFVNAMTGWLIRPWF